MNSSGICRQIFLRQSALCCMSRPNRQDSFPTFSPELRRMPVVHARDRQRLEAGTIYVAPPDRHLIVEPGHLRVTSGPRENRFRPAIDPLFRSAAQVYGPAAIGVILTGNLQDGTEGLRAVKQLGGVAIVQDEKDALFPAMPAHAAHHVPVDYRVPTQRTGRTARQARIVREQGRVGSARRLSEAPRSSATSTRRGRACNARPVKR